MVPRCRRNGGFYLLVMTADFSHLLREVAAVKDQTTNRRRNPGAR